jgi:hypothetical protein
MTSCGPAGMCGHSPDCPDFSCEGRPMRATCSPGHCAGSETCLRSLCINHPSNHCGGGIPLHPTFHARDGGHHVSGEDSLRIDPPLTSPASMQAKTIGLLFFLFFGVTGLVGIVLYFAKHS